ncbi:MAG: hypothetical protein ACP5XB_32215, partial [Isosphaeraceae bacterium]
SLSLNFATSAAGNLRVEIDDNAGRPLAGFALADCDEVFGDSLDRTVTWKGNPDLSPLAGKPVHLRVVMSDADLFSFQFVDHDSTARDVRGATPRQGGPGSSSSGWHETKTSSRTLRVQSQRAAGQVGQARNGPGVVPGDVDHDVAHLGK